MRKIAPTLQETEGNSLYARNIFVKGFVLPDMVSASQRSSVGKFMQREPRVLPCWPSFLFTHLLARDSVHWSNLALGEMMTYKGIS